MRTIEKYLIALYFFISPFEIALHLLITSSTKYVGLMILLVEGCVLLSKSRGAIITLSLSSKSIIIWVAYCVLTLAWTSLNNYTFEYITTYILMSTLLLVSTFELWDSGTVNLFKNAYMFGSLLMAMTAVFFGGGQYLDRETIVILGKECDPNQVAANIIPGIVMFLDIGLNKNKNRLINVCGYAGTVFCIYSVFLTGSRGGFVTLAVCIITVLIIAKKNNRLSSAYIISTFVIGIIGYYYFFMQQEWRVLDFSSYTSTYANGSGRTVIWKALLSSFDIKWIWGHGVGSSISYFQDMWGKTVAVHNTFLLVLYEVGILGFGIYLFSYIYMAFHYRKNEVLFSVLIGSLISSFFLDALNQRYIWNSLMLCIMQYNAETIQPQIQARSNGCEYKYIR